MVSMILRWMRGFGLTGCAAVALCAPTAGAQTQDSFPDGRQQLVNYLNASFGPLAFGRAAIGAGLDQSKPAPPEWDSSAKGFGERYGFRFGMSLMDQGTKYALGAALGQDVSYRRCLCSGFAPRSGHALVSLLTARTRHGSTVFSVPALAGPYAGAFGAMKAWYPARYEAMDAARLGSTSFAMQFGANMLREFLPHRR